MKKIIIVVITFIFFGSSFGQSIEKNWKFTAIENAKGESLFSINSEKDLFNLKEGEFEYQLEAKGDLKASGDYLIQNNLLILFYSKPSDTIRRYRISEISDSTLTFSENNVRYSFKAAPPVKEIIPKDTKETESIIPVQGFTMNSLWRGILGMITLLGIAFLFSSNRKAINWKTVGIGLTL